MFALNQEGVCSAPTSQSSATSSLSLSVDRTHPFRNLLVCIQRLATTLSQDLIFIIIDVILRLVDRRLDGIARRAGRRGVGAVRDCEAKDIQWIKHKLGLALGAVVELAVGAIRAAVVGQVDVVDLGEAAVILDRVDGERDDRVGRAAGGEVCEIGLEEGQVCEGALVPARYFNEDEADEGCQCQRHWREDACYSPAFAHVRDFLLDAV